MTVPSGAILRIVPTLVWDDGEVNQNVYNAVVSGGSPPYDEADILDDAEEWVDALYDNMLAQVDPNLSGSHVTVYVYDSVQDDWDEVGQIAWSWVGTATPAELPRGVAALINAKTVDADVNGKKYLPGTVEGSLTDGLWTAGMVTALGLFAGDWVSDFVGVGSGATWAPVIWSVVNLVAKDMTGTVIIPIIPAYQRRRKNNVGI